MALYATLAPAAMRTTTSILRRADGAVIPQDPANTDYAAYLAWVALGNTPDPTP